jgi:hypothetical protein
MDGVFFACSATCTVVVGPLGTVVAEPELDGEPELPHAASMRPRDMDSGTSRRLRTARAYRFASPGGIRPAFAGRGRGGSVRRVRRLAVLALAAAVATAGLLASAIAPAWAHICPVAAQVPIAQASTIDVGVTVEGAAVPDVEIDLPSGLTLDRIDPKAGWTVTRSGATLRYHGGPIEAYTCEYFPLVVTAPSRGAFGVTVIQRSANGAVLARSIPDLNSAASHALDQFVYAGVKPPSPPSNSGGPSGAIVAGIALVVLGVVMFAFVRIRSRRAAPHDDTDVDDDTDGDGAGASEREAELRARVQRFKARAPDRPTRG